MPSTSAHHASARAAREITIAPYEEVSTPENFLDHWLQLSLNYIRPTLLITIGLVMFFYPIDPIVLTPQAADFLQAARVFVMVPLLAVFFVLTYTKVPAEVYFFWLSMLYLVGGLSFVIACYISGPGSIHYTLVALVQTLTFLFISCRIPSRFCIPTGLIILASANYVVGFKLQVDDTDRWMFTFGLFTLTLLYSTSVLVRDRNGRDFFNSLFASARVSNDNDQWASMITRVLKHELGNQLTGLSSSLELMNLSGQGAANKQHGRQHTVSRAESGRIEQNLNHIASLRSLLTRTSEYLSIDLKERRFTEYSRVSLVEVVNDARFNFSSRHETVSVYNQLSNQNFHVEGNGLLMTIALEGFLEYINSLIASSNNWRVLISVSLQQDRYLVLSSEPSWPVSYGTGEPSLEGLDSNQANSAEFSFRVASHIIELHGGKVEFKFNSLLQKPALQLYFPPAKP